MACSGCGTGWSSPAIPTTDTTFDWDGQWAGVVGFDAEFADSIVLTVNAGVVSGTRRGVTASCAIDSLSQETNFRHCVIHIDLPESRWRLYLTQPYGYVTGGLAHQAYGPVYALNDSTTDIAEGYAVLAQVAQ